MEAWLLICPAAQRLLAPLQEWASQQPLMCLLAWESLVDRAAMCNARGVGIKMVEGLNETIKSHSIKICNSVFCCIHYCTTSRKDFVKTSWSRKHQVFLLLFTTPGATKLWVMLLCNASRREVSVPSRRPVSQSPVAILPMYHRSLGRQLERVALGSLRDRQGGFFLVEQNKHFVEKGRVFLTLGYAQPLEQWMRDKFNPIASRHSLSPERLKKVYPWEINAAPKSLSFFVSTKGVHCILSTWLHHLGQCNCFGLWSRPWHESGLHWVRAQHRGRCWNHLQVGREDIHWNLKHNEISLWTWVLGSQVKSCLDQSWHELSRLVIGILYSIIIQYNINIT